MKKNDSRSLVETALGLAIIGALLTLAGGWALPAIVGAIVLMVIAHEFGHFITAKKSGMKVTDFFVGFGPVVWSKQVGETRYGLRALLLGGYVKVPGMSWAEQIPEDQESRTYRSATYPRKVLFASAGSLMHLVLALILAWASLSFVGQPSVSHVEISSFTHWYGFNLNVAQRAGLKIGDEIVAVDGHSVTSLNALIAFVHGHAGDRLSIEVVRHGKELTLSATPKDGRTVKVDGQLLATGAHSVGYLGVGLSPMVERDSWYSAIPGSFSEVGSTLKAAVDGIGHVFTPREFSSLFHQVASAKAAKNPINQQSRPESIVGVVRIAVQSSHEGFGPPLAILIDVNIFVGVLNMLPMLPLDGGYVAIATYERIRSRRGVRYRAEVNRLAPLVYAFVVILGVLFICTLYLDIAHPIANPF